LNSLTPRSGQRLFLLDLKRLKKKQPSPLAKPAIQLGSGI